jgi:pimeloyl-ACP methyl ester carboxylesterase
VSVGCSAEEQADALVELLDALGIGQVHLVAISAAGHVGIELARRHPHRVDRVSFESAVAMPWSGTTRLGGRVLFGPLQALVWGAIRASLRIAPSAGLYLQLVPLTTLDAAQVVRGMDHETRQKHLAAFRSLWSGRGFACDLTHESPSDAPIPQQALILRGAHDRSVPHAHAARLAALAPHHELVEVDAESHFIWFGRAAAEVWDRRLAFLSGE